MFGSLITFAKDIIIGEEPEKVLKKALYTRLEADEKRILGTLNFHKKELDAKNNDFFKKQDSWLEDLERTYDHWNNYFKDFNYMKKYCYENMDSIIDSFLKDNNKAFKRKLYNNSGNTYRIILSNDVCTILDLIEKNIEVIKKEDKVKQKLLEEENKRQKLLEEENKRQKLLEEENKRQKLLEEENNKERMLKNEREREEVVLFLKNNIIIFDSNIYMNSSYESIFHFFIQNNINNILMTQQQYDEIDNIKNHDSRAAKRIIELLSKTDNLTIHNVNIYSNPKAYADPELIEYIRKFCSENHNVLFVTDDRDLSIRTMQKVKADGNNNNLIVFSGSELRYQLNDFLSF